MPASGAWRLDMVAGTEAIVRVNATNSQAVNVAQSLYAISLDFPASLENSKQMRTKRATRTTKTPFLANCINPLLPSSPQCP